ncbi:hypothetical protein DPMN_114541 [Dreissena polymorpha]|uniref:Uncharacterized protein n=1 Tax=Dreissena polymorpha TaxID=45954 RepID=A0A9D4KKD1_DREPO|nr:hypothetical protein DPMN_114541 [Dreissena polymorpha]
MLENWERRERRSICLANQLDLMAATALETAWELSDSVPEELRALFLYISRTTQFLSHNAASSMSEMLRICRDLAQNCSFHSRFHYWRQDTGGNHGCSGTRSLLL